MANVTPFIESPLAVTLVGVACAALIAFTTAIIKMALQLTRVEASIAGLREDIAGIKQDPDIMRWSSYGRVTQVGLLPHQNPGV